jgi:PTS system nitrogen regulatory IIA component
LAELASLLRRDQRELSKLASRGQLPGRKVGGDWRFARSDIRQWLEAGMAEFDDDQLKHFEDSHPDVAEPLLTNLLAPAAVEIPLPARTSASVLREMVRLAEQTWQVYDPEAVLEAVKAREDVSSTAQESGVALLHPHRPLPKALGESVVAFGRTAGGIPFGGARSRMTDLFFLDCCRDDRTHLRVLARLSRLILRPGFLDALRAAETAADALRVIREAEAALLTAD